jgi:hypothetical protein
MSEETKAKLIKVGKGVALVLTGAVLTAGAIFGAGFFLKKNGGGESSQGGN